MEHDTTREGFEKLISEPPYERSIERFDGDGFAWPGHYVAYPVQLAWEMYQAAKADELAFLEDCIRGDMWKRENAIRNRIADLKERAVGEVELPKKPAPSYAPVYAAALYPQLATIARKHGYALAAHGSLQRDFDLIAIPWVDNPSAPEEVVAEFTSTFAIREVGGPPSDKPHGRRCWSLSIGHGECCIDLSFMPLAALASRPAIDLAKSCEWSIDDDSVSGSWDTGCGNSFILNDGTPSENCMKHCCYCGGHLIAGETK